jgi:LIVCS family branched-chain amino acid:cation transporter
LATVKETKLIQLLGNLISPALLISLGVILVKGILHPQALVTVNTSAWDVFTHQAILGYQHLDLLGTIFFGSIVLGILKKTAASSTDYDLKSLAKIGLQAGLLGCFLLTIVYIGMGLLGAFHGQGLENHENLAQLFSIISHKILGTQGALVIATAVAMACFSTIIALAAVLAEYIQHDVSQNKLGYVPSLAITLLLTTVISWNGLAQLTAYANPIINTLYPLLITLTFLNIAYKLWNFKPIKIPVLITLIVSMYLNWPSYAVYGITYGQHTTEQRDLN